MTQGADRPVFDREAQPDDPRENLRRDWVRMPEWGGQEVCVWQLSARQQNKLVLATQDVKDPIKRMELAEVMRVCRSCYDGDSTDAETVFTETEDLEWLMEQPSSAIRRICEKSQEIDGEAAIATEDLVAFFVAIPAVLGCLSTIVSACECCTDCPRNSQPTCPKNLSDAVLQRIESFGDTSMAASATPVSTE